MLLQTNKKQILNADDLYNYYLYEIKNYLTYIDLYKEHLFCIGLDKNYYALYCNLASIGHDNKVTANVKDLIRYAATYNAKYVVMIHNHPGSSEPSEPDIEITRKWGRAMMGVGIKLNEHIVVKDDGYTSIVNIIKERKENAK